MNYLVPVDFSDATSPVLAYLAKMATPGDDITLIHVAEPNPAFVGYEAGPDVVRGQMAEAYKNEHKEIQALSKGLRDQGLNCKGLLVQGGTIDAILKSAAKAKADMIVMGSHGHSAAYQILVGSVSEGVLHKSDIPVLFIPIRKK